MSKQTIQHHTGGVRCRERVGVQQQEQIKFQLFEGCGCRQSILLFIVEDI